MASSRFRPRDENRPEQTADAGEAVARREEPELALIVGAARSGTTLIRLLLDAHPDVGAPGEAGLPGLIAHMVQVWSMVHADGLGRSQDDPGATAEDAAALTRWEEPPRSLAEDEERQALAPVAPRERELPEATRRWVRDAVRVPMREYCGQGRKRLYCDKSLDSVHHLELVRGVFPEVRVVLVFRHVMDTIASGIEASPWGFQAYGYTPYVRASPGNAVAALAAYWLDHVTQALSWEEEHPASCHRVRYEDLVLAPETILAGIERFLGVQEDLSILGAAFDREPPRGPGDYKVDFTTGVHSQAIGHGKRVPVTMLPPPLLKALNERLEALNYEPLDRGWNTAERIVDGGGQGFWAQRLCELMSDVTIGSGVSGLGVFAVVAEDHRSLRWVIDPEAGTVEQRDGDVDEVLTGTAEDLVLMLTGEENLGVLLRSGRIRHVADEVETQWRDLRHELNAIVCLFCHKSDRALATSSGEDALRAMEEAEFPT
jgi:hypothetical protein